MIAKRTIKTGEDWDRLDICDSLKWRVGRGISDRLIAQIRKNRNVILVERDHSLKQSTAI